MKNWPFQREKKGGEEGGYLEGIKRKEALSPGEKHEAPETITREECTSCSRSEKEFPFGKRASAIPAKGEGEKCIASLLLTNRRGKGGEKTFPFLRKEGEEVSHHRGRKGRKNVLYLDPRS